MGRVEIKHPQRKAYTGGYADGVRIGDLLFVSGQGPLDLSTGEVVHGTIEEETRLTLENVAGVLAEGGCSKGDVARCTCHLADIADFEKFDKVFAEFFDGVRPTRTTVQSVLGLGIKVEIDAIAYCPSTREKDDQ